MDDNKSALRNALAVLERDLAQAVAKWLRFHRQPEALARLGVDAVDVVEHAADVLDTVLGLCTSLNSLNEDRSKDADAYFGLHLPKETNQ